MKRFILVILGLLFIGSVSFADAISKAEVAMEKAKVECNEAWDELYNCKMMSLEEFTAEYKKNHFALSGYSKDWSASLSKAFKEYQKEVIQKQKELWDIYYEKEAKEKKATQAWLDAIDAEMSESEKLQEKIDELQAEKDELLKSY